MTTSISEQPSKPDQYLVIKHFLENKKLTIVEGTTYWMEDKHVLEVKFQKLNLPVRYCNPRNAKSGLEWYPYTLEGVDAAMEDIRKIAVDTFLTARDKLYQDHYKDTTEAMALLGSLFNESGTELLPQQSTSPAFWEHISLA